MAQIPLFAPLKGVVPWTLSAKSIRRFPTEIRSTGDFFDLQVGDGVTGGGISTKEEND